MRVVVTGTAALLLAAGTGVLAQPPAGPGPGAAPADPQLDTHLAGWEKTMKSVTNLNARFDLTKTEAAFKRERKYVGSVLCMKPNYTILRIESASNPADYEAYLCNGKSIFQYEGAAKTITEFKLNPAAGGDNLMLDFLNGMTAAAAKQRFQMALFNPKNANPNQLYVYLDIKPTLGKDKQEFEQARFALFGPGAPAELHYLPAQVYLRKPNGDSELWTFAEQKTNLPGIDATKFQYQPIKDWQFKQAPAGPPPGPGAPMVPGLPAPGPAKGP